MVPIAQFGGHSHWVWQTRFNPQYDSLLLSASSDSLVNLWLNLTAFDSAGKGSAATHNAANPTSLPQAKSYGKENQRGRAHLYDGHEDSVYGE